MDRTGGMSDIARTVNKMLTWLTSVRAFIYLKNLPSSPGGCVSSGSLWTWINNKKAPATVAVIR
jgi:hypothetical protein